MNRVAAFPSSTRLLARACLLGLGLVVGGACRAPTQILLELSTNLPCSALRGVAISVARGASVETAAPVTLANGCLNGRIGQLVIFPGEDNDGGFAVKVTAGLMRQVEECTAATAYKGCIVARRKVRFLESSTLRLPVSLRAECLDVACSEATTCARPDRCVDATVDQSQCEASGVCDVEEEPSTGADAAPGVTDSAPLQDAATDAAGVVGTPAGFLLCPAGGRMATCDLATDYCCVTPSRGDGGGCFRRTTPCGFTGDGSRAIMCDSASDCTGSEVCCFRAPTMGLSSVGCAVTTSCSGTQDFELCFPATQSTDCRNAARPRCIALDGWAGYYRCSP